MTNTQRRFLRKLYRKGSMSFDYLQKKYPGYQYDFHLSSPDFQKYVQKTNDGTGITVTILAVEELEDFRRYLKHWRIPTYLSAVSVITAILALVISLLQKLLC